MKQLPGLLVFIYLFTSGWRLRFSFIEPRLVSNIGRHQILDMKQRSCMCIKSTMWRMTYMCERRGMWGQSLEYD